MLSHTLQFAVLLAMFTNLTQHAVYLCWRKRDWPSAPHYIRFGPAYMVALSTVLVMVHPTHTVLKIGGQVDRLTGPWGAAIYTCTLVGYAMLCIGALWAADVWGKLQRVAGQSVHEL
mmetsp:Transcript_125346/g.360102  ORF Transcript_125346/g.360102 Transcript_125346/m.360102 type:complete len:117 (+) Transcript_125346:367-717(+)